MSADYIELIAKKTGINFVLQDNPTWQSVMNSARSGKLDLLAAVMKSQQRNEFLDFATPHIKYPMVIASSKDDDFINSVEELKHKTVTVVKGYVTEDIFRLNHPSIKLVPVDNLQQALKLVSSGEVDALVDNLASITHSISRLGITNLRISGTTPYEFALSIGVTKEHTALLAIIQAALDSISEREHLEIRNKWVSVNYSRPIDYKNIIIMSCVVLLIMLLILFWNWRLSREVNARKTVEDALKKLREVDKGWRPILFLSSFNDPESFVKGIYSGGDDYLYKPIDKEILEAKLHAMKRIVAMRKELLDVSKKLADEKDKIKRIANQDGLTGIANRRFLDSRLEQEFRRFTRSDKVLSFIMIDVDDFKSFNDNFGHLAGDDALRLCAQKMSELIDRAGDLVARYGGEEFCLVLPNTDLEGAINIAETLRKEIIKLNILRDDLETTKHLTISLGVSSLRAEQNQTIEILIDAADKALYQAKQGGRNQVCFAEI